MFILTIFNLLTALPPVKAMSVTESLGGHALKQVACIRVGTVYRYYCVGRPICSGLNTSRPDQSPAAHMMFTTKYGSRWLRVPVCCTAAQTSPAAANFQVLIVWECGCCLWSDKEMHDPSDCWR